MPFDFQALELPGAFLIKPQVIGDDRGFFLETYKESDFIANGIDAQFVQDSYSQSASGILRGLHFQRGPKAQGKLVRVMRGEIFDVGIDIREGSPTYGKSAVLTLAGDSKEMVYWPPWFAHGFYVLSEKAEVAYKFTAEYAPELEGGIIWNDPHLAIPWPGKDPVLSERDRGWPSLAHADTGFVSDPASEEGPDDVVQLAC